MSEPPIDNSNYVDLLEFQLKQADTRIAQLDELLQQCAKQHDIWRERALLAGWEPPQQEEK